MSDYIPEEVVVEILVRLPVKSLIRFTTVCKSSKSLLQSSLFIQTHLTRRNHDSSSLLLLKLNETGKYNRFVIHSLEKNGESKNLSHPALLGQQKETTICTCNGLVFLSSSSPSPYFAIIWNPTIRRFVNLPTPRRVVDPLPDVFYAFGHDMPTNDYRVFRILVNNINRTRCEFEVYSLVMGSWKTLRHVVVPESYLSFGHGIYLNGALHWFRGAYGDQGNYSIVIFDMHSKSFREMVVPEAITEWPCKTRFNQYRESLAVVVFTEWEMFLATARVRVMNEYGVTDSWNMLYSVRLEEHSLEHILPHGLTKKGEILLRKICHHWPFYVVTREAVSLEVVGNWHRYQIGFIGSFVESLVLLGQAGAIMM